MPRRGSRGMLGRMRILLWSATAAALALLLWLMRRPPPPLPASVTMLPSAASPLLEGADPVLEDLRTLLHHGDPVVAGRALERLRELGKHDALDANDLGRAGRLAVEGAEYPRRHALLLLLDISYVDWFPRAADFLASKPGPISHDLLMNMLVKRAPEHRARLDEIARAGKEDALTRTVREVLFWLDRDQVPALPPGYATSELQAAPRSSEVNPVR